jgi:branched-chain amino acid transport system substrate-binding protein
MVAAFCAFVLGCGPSEPIRIGFVGGMSGRIADLGIAGRDAAQLAVEWRNEDGGIHGRRVQVIIKDDEQKPEKVASSRIRGPGGKGGSEGSRRNTLLQ